MSSLVFDKYEILKRLAVGGMGEVFLARQVGLGGFERIVILKSLLPDLADQDDFVEQFLDEARVAATLNHPNIVQIFEVGKWHGVYFLAMEYISGGNLAEIRRLGSKASIPMPLQVAVRIIHDAALGLDHAHQAVDVQGRPLGIVHRDISPQNIMARADGVTKVVDFGIAKAANKMSRTATGMLKGKYAYMSPEQIASKDLDGRSDQFALGVVLWEMCAGKRLFRADNEMGTLRNVLKAPIPKLSEVVEGMPSVIDDVVERMLQRNRDLRYPRLLDAARDLSIFLDESSRGGQRADVAEYVSRVQPEEVSNPAATPSSTKENFLISLSPFSAPLPSTDSDEPFEVIVEPTGYETGETKALVAGKGSRAALFGVAGLLTLGVAALVLLGPWTSDSRHDATTRDGVSHEDGPRQEVFRAPSALVRQEPLAGVLRVLEPVGAALFVADEAWPEAVPTSITNLAPGEHLLRFVMSDGTEILETVTLDPPPPAAAIFRTDPEGATVLVGGETRGTTPLRVDSLPPGEPLSITLQLEGHRPHEMEITIASGEVRDLSVVLSSLPRRVSRTGRRPTGTRATTPAQPTKAEAESGAPAVDGFITLNTTPWTRVSIGGRSLGTTPLFRRALPPGEHVLTLENEERGVRVQHRVTIQEGQNLRVDLDLSG